MFVFILEQHFQQFWVICNEFKQFRISYLTLSVPSTFEKSHILRGKVLQRIPTSNADIWLPLYPNLKSRTPLERKFNSLSKKWRPFFFILNESIVMSDRKEPRISDPSWRVILSLALKGLNIKNIERFKSRFLCLFSS